jgi:hypothetical protein
LYGISDFNPFSEFQMQVLKWSLPAWFHLLQSIQDGNKVRWFQREKASQARPDNFRFIGVSPFQGSPYSQLLNQTVVT